MSTIDEKISFIAGIANFVTFFVVLIHIVMMVYRYNEYRKIRSISAYMLGFGILGSVFYDVCAGLFGISLFCRINVIHVELESLLMINWFEALFWHFGQINAYLYLLHPLYVGFRGTQYAISKMTFTILVKLLIVYLIFCGTFVFLISLLLADGLDIFSSNIYGNLLNITNSVHLTIDFVLSISLLLLFIQKLLKLGEKMYNIDDIEMDNLDEHNKDEDFIRRRDQIFMVITRVSILGFIMIIASQLMLISTTLMTTSVDKGYHSIFIYMYIWSQTIHLFIVPLCLLFGFEFTRLYYDIYCGCCHNRLKRYCIKRMDIKMTKQLQYNRI